MIRKCGSFFLQLEKSFLAQPTSNLLNCLLKSPKFEGEFELMFTNTEVHKIVRISKTNQDNPNL